jgi:hypothetical protein
LDHYKNRPLIFSTQITIALVCSALFWLPVEARNWQNPDSVGLVVIRGRVVCLDDSGRPADSVFRCGERVSRLGIVDKESNLYTFDPTDPATAMFSDARVRARVLQVAARVKAKRELELIKVQSVREGTLCDIYYFCEVCNIRAYAPGPCPCCRDELEFRETPA